MLNTEVNMKNKFICFIAMLLGLSWTIFAMDPEETAETESGRIQQPPSEDEQSRGQEGAISRQDQPAGERPRFGGWRGLGRGGWGSGWGGGWGSRWGGGWGSGFGYGYGDYSRYGLAGSNPYLAMDPRRDPYSTLNSKSEIVCMREEETEEKQQLQCTRLCNTFEGQGKFLSAYANRGGTYCESPEKSVLCTCYWQKDMENKDKLISPSDKDKPAQPYISK